MTYFQIVKDKFTKVNPEYHCDSCYFKETGLCNQHCGNKNKTQKVNIAASQNSQAVSETTELTK